MITREHVKTEIDHMPEALVEKVHAFIKHIKKEKSPKSPLPTYKLKGAFDREDIRSKAYE